MTGSVDHLIDSLIDETCSGSEADELNVLLETDESVRRRYLQRMTMHALLERQLAGTRVLELSMTETSGPISRPTVRSIRARITRIAAAALMSIVMAALLAWRITPADIPEQAPAPLAYLVGDHKSTISDRTPVSNDMALWAQPLELEQGQTLLKFACGAEIRVLAPTRILLLDPMQIYLEYGRIEANCPESAHGFAVDSPQGRVIDLGTRFSMELGTNANEGMNVSVTEGMVRIEPGSIPITIRQGEQVVVVGNKVIRRPSIALNAGEKRVANFRSDFRPEQIIKGWKYLWNAPEGWGRSSPLKRSAWTTGPVGDPTCYKPLQRMANLKLADGQTMHDLWGVSAELETPAHKMVRSLKFSRRHGHPGIGPLPGSAGRYLPRYAILGYTIQDEEGAGQFRIGDSYLLLSQLDSDGLDLQIHVNDRAPVLVRSILPGSVEHFDVQLGDLHPGDTVYIAFGPNGKSYRDGFQFDFSLIQKRASDIDSKQEVPVK